MVDVPADHPVEPALVALVGDGFLEVADEVHRGLDLVLEVRRQRPVAVAPAPPPVVQPTVEEQGELVGGIAEERQPAVVAGDHVELVAVYHQQLAAVGGTVHRLVDQADVAEDQARIAAQEFVMVAGDVDHLGAALAQGEQAADHVGVRLRPVDAAAQLPAVDDVAHQVDAIGVVALEERRQVFGLAIPRPQVDIRDPQGPNPLLAVRGEALRGAHRRVSDGVFPILDGAGETTVTGRRPLRDRARLSVAGASG